jgi:hypothetical protein
MKVIEKEMHEQQASKHLFKHTQSQHNHNQSQSQQSSQHSTPLFSIHVYACEFSETAHKPTNFTTLKS